MNHVQWIADYCSFTDVLSLRLCCRGTRRDVQGMQSLSITTHASTSLLRMCSRLFPHVKHLVLLDGCHLIQDNVFVLDAWLLESLRVERARDFLGRMTSEDGLALQVLHTLRSLSLSESITGDREVSELLRHCVNVRELKLKAMHCLTVLRPPPRCESLTVDCLGRVSSLVLDCPLLQTLSAVQCCRLWDVTLQRTGNITHCDLSSTLVPAGAVEALAAANPRLTVLVLVNCRDLVSLSLSGAHLQRLDVSCCRCLSSLTLHLPVLGILRVALNHVLATLVLDCAALDTLDVSMLTELRHVRLRLPHLQALDLSGCLQLNCIETTLLPAEIQLRHLPHVASDEATMTGHFHVLATLLQRRRDLRLNGWSNEYPMFSHPGDATRDTLGQRHPTGGQFMRRSASM